MNYSVYILFSESTGRYYLGQTEDVLERLSRHNKGYERSTSPYKPWKLVWICHKTNRSESMRLEKKLKNLSKLRLINFIEKYIEGRDEAESLS